MGYKDGRVKEKQISYVSCPMCGRNRVLELVSDKALAKDKAERLRWNFFDPESSYIIQIREAGGKGHEGHGFVFKEGFTWAEIKNNPLYADQVRRIKEQLARLTVLLEE